MPQCLRLFAVASVVILHAKCGAHEEDDPDLVDLTVDGFWWFERLYGVPRHYSSPTSCISTDKTGSHFIALPQYPYVILMLCSPWWIHCRHAVSEFERFLDGVHAAGLDKQLLALTVDCSWSRMVPLCINFLGLPRAVKPLWQDGVNAPAIGKLVYSSLADYWPEASFPGLVLSSRKDLIDFGHGYGAGAGIARVSPAPVTAEGILDWVMQSNIGVFSDLSSILISELRPPARPDFHVTLLHIREHLENRHPTVHGCECKTTWRYCPHNVFGIIHPGQKTCHMVVGCPSKLEHCETTWSCGPSHETSDQCSPVSSFQGAAKAADEKVPKHGEEEDSIAALALWLHEIFERHTFELPEDDPKQQRFNIFMDFLRTLCTYFPDHLGGSSSSGKDCRKSLCRLGGILETKGLWKVYTEEIEVALENSALQPGGDSGKPLLEEHRTRVRRFRWRELERDWRLCGRPWTEFGKSGWIGCKADNPFARGFPCGVWNLIHAIMAQVARVHDSDLAGQNETAKELDILRETREREQRLAAAKLKKAESKNASLPNLIKLSPLSSKGRRCYYVWGPNKFLNVTRAENITAKIQVKRLKPVDHVEGVLMKLGADSVHAAVMFQLVNDYIRDDDGAIVFKVVQGPKKFRLAQNQSWKLRTINGVPAHHQDWRVMLHESLTLGDTTLTLEGPIPCNNDTSLPCHSECAEFNFEEDPNPRVTSKYVPVGKLREKTTGQCFGHLTKPHWFFWSIDLGIGLVDCGAASEYKFEEKSFLRDVRFCNTNPAYSHDCQRIVLHLTFNHRKWVPFVKPRPAMTARIESPRVVVGQIRKMVALFWHCKECRDNFHSLELGSVENIKHPRDAVLWWWRVHNDINSNLRTAKDHVPSSPLDPKYPKEPWPPRWLCPQCWNASKRRHDVARTARDRTAESFNEKEVYRFLVNSFYASVEKRTIQTRQRWIPMPYGSSQVVLQRRPAPWLAFFGFGFVVVTGVAILSVILLRLQAKHHCHFPASPRTLEVASARQVGLVDAFTCEAAYVQCSTVDTEINATKL